MGQTDKNQLKNRIVSRKARALHAKLYFFETLFFFKKFMLLKLCTLRCVSGMETAI